MNKEVTFHINNMAYTVTIDENIFLELSKYLDLDNTKIKELPKCLGNLQNLDWIHISGTNITEFPVEILNAPKLSSVQAKGLKLNNYKEVKVICEKKKITFLYDE